MVLEYEVWYNQGTITNTYVFFGAVNSASFEQIITPVSSGDAYAIKVRGRNRVGYSSFSPEVTVYAATVPAAPNAPTRVAGTNSQTSITITWTPNSNGGQTITNYQVWWNGGGSGPVTGMLSDTGSTSTTYVASSLSAGTYYAFAIKAINIVGVSDLSLSTSLIAATISNAPTSLQLVSQSSTTITVSWTAPANTGGTPLTNYKLKWNASGSMQVLDPNISSSTL